MNPPPEQQGPFLLEIGLDWFLDKFIRGVHGFATVSKSFGDYLRSKDPADQHIHVDYPEEAPSLAYIYPINFWRESVKRMSEVKQRSEAERQARFLRDELARELAQKYAKREQEIERVLGILYARFGQSKLVKSNSKKNLRVFIITCLSGGGHPEVRLKLGICKETIEEFLSLPQPQGGEEDYLQFLVEEPQPKTEGVRVV